MEITQSTTLGEIMKQCEGEGNCPDCEVHRFCASEIDGMPRNWKLPEWPQVREVKRQAMPGEYIKLTTADYTFNHVGDILKIDGAESAHNISFVLEKNRASHENCIPSQFRWNYFPREYVVLENYHPEQKKTAPSAGDTENGSCENVDTEKVTHNGENVNIPLIEMSQSGDLIVHPSAFAVLKAVKSHLEGDE